jgi:tRNA-Thr(GGU) m(6)t(6)A37 methyltransferase TsaA
VTSAGTEPLPVVLRPIGYVHSDFVVHHEAPRQPGRGCVAERAGEIRIGAGLQNCLQDLAGFSHVWVLFWCHRARGFNHQVVPPRDTVKRGLFATRAPHRPNPIGLSCVRLVAIEKRSLWIGAHDLLDGTPVLDLKPYIPQYDSVPDAAIGWVAGLPADAPDHRPWWTDKGVEPPAVYRRRACANGARQDREGDTPSA